MSRWLLIETSHFISPPSAAGLTPELLSQSPVISGQMRHSMGAAPDVIYQKQKQTKGKWGELGHPRDDGVRRNELKFQLVPVCNLVCGVFRDDKNRLKQHLRLFIS